MEPESSDEELILRAEGGDADGFDELVLRYSRPLYEMVYNMTSSHEETNDMLQDVYFKAYHSLSEFQRKSSFQTWISSIATEMTTEFLQKRGRLR